MEDNRGIRTPDSVTVPTSDASAYSTPAVRPRVDGAADSLIVAIEHTTALTTTSDMVYFEGSNDGTTWVPIYDAAGTRLSAKVSASAARGVGLTEDQAFQLSAFPYVRMQVVTSGGAAVQQTTTNRTFRVYYRNRR